MSFSWKWHFIDVRLHLQLVLALMFPVDSLTYRQGQWRSLDDFSRTSTPRRTMDLTDHMIPEEPSYDVIDSFPGPCRSPPKMNRSTDRQHQHQYEEPSRSQAFRGTDFDTGSLEDFEPDAAIRRRIHASDDVQDNNLINSQLQEMHASAGNASDSASGESSLRNGQAAGVSPGVETRSTTCGLVMFWTFVFTIFLLGIIVVVAIFRVPGLVSSGGRGSGLPDLQEIEPEQYDRSLD